MLLCPWSSFPERREGGKKTKSVLKQRHGGIDKRKDQSRPAQPKSSNTQLDECLRCKQLWGTGVDQDLTVTCKDGLVCSLHAGTGHLARYYLLIPTSLACLHHGLTEGYAPHLNDLINLSHAPAARRAVNPFCQPSGWFYLVDWEHFYFFTSTVIFGLEKWLLINSLVPHCLSIWPSIF